MENKKNCSKFSSERWSRKSNLPKIEDSVIRTSLRNNLPGISTCKYSAWSLEADHSPQRNTTRNNTSAPSLCIWISVPESGGRGANRQPTAVIRKKDPMVVWQLAVGAHALGISISRPGLFLSNQFDCRFGILSSSCTFHSLEVLS